MSPTVEDLDALLKAERAWADREIRALEYEIKVLQRENERLNRFLDRRKMFG